MVTYDLQLLPKCYGFTMGMLWWDMTYSYYRNAMDLLQIYYGDILYDLQLPTGFMGKPQNLLMYNFLLIFDLKFYLNKERKTTFLRKNSRVKEVLVPNRSLNLNFSELDWSSVQSSVDGWNWTTSPVLGSGKIQKFEPNSFVVSK